MLVLRKISPLALLLLLSAGFSDPLKRSADRQVLRDIIRRQEQEKEALQERHHAELLAARGQTEHGDREAADGAPAPVPLDELALRDFVINGFVRLKPRLPLSFHDLIFNRTYAVLRDEFNHGNNILARLPQLRRLLADPVVDGALRSVLGPDYILHPHRYCHESHPAVQPWHKDTYFDYMQSHWHNPHWAMIFYFPQDAPHELGPTRVARGSHVLETGDGGSSLDVHELQAEAGDVYLFHYNLLHSGGRNAMREWAGATGMQHSFANPRYNPPYPPRDRQRVVYKFQFVRIRPPSARIVPAGRLSKGACSQYRPWSEKLLPTLPPPQPVSFEASLSDMHRKAVLEIVAAALHRYVTGKGASKAAIVGPSLATDSEVKMHVDAMLAMAHDTNTGTDAATNAIGATQHRNRLSDIATTPGDQDFVRQALRQGLGYYRKHYQHRAQLQQRLTPLWRTMWGWLRGERHENACAGTDEEGLPVHIGWKDVDARIAVLRQGATSAVGDPSGEPEQLNAAYSLARAVGGGNTSLATAAHEALHAALRSRTSYVRTAAAHALASIGPAAVAPLIAELKAEHMRAAQLAHRRQNGQVEGGTGGSNSSKCPSAPDWARGATAGAWTTPQWQQCDDFLAAVATALGGAATTATAASHAAKSLLALLAPLRPPPLPSPSAQCAREYAHSWTGWHESDVLPLARRNAIEALGVVGSVLVAERQAPASLHRIASRIADRLAPIVEAANEQGDAEKNPENGEGQSHGAFRTSAIARITHRGFMAALALAQLGPRALLNVSPASGAPTHISRAAHALLTAARADDGDRYVRALATDALRAGLSSRVHAHSPLDGIMKQLVDVLMLARFDASTNQFSAF